MKISKIVLYLIIMLHLAIALAYMAGFLIPSSVWPQRIDAHFWLCLSLLILSYIWGLMWTLKFRDHIYSICLLDTLEQSLRGYSIYDSRNYNYSFIEELLSALKIKIFSRRFIDWFQIIFTVLTGVLYVLKTYGIILY